MLVKSNQVTSRALVLHSDRPLGVCGCARDLPACVRGDDHRVGGLVCKLAAKGSIPGLVRVVLVVKSNLANLILSPRMFL